MSSIVARNLVRYFEDTNHLKISTKDGQKTKKLVPPKIKGKHFTNMDFLVNAELIWLTPNCYPSHIFNPNSDDCYFEQCFRTSEKLGEGSYGSVIKVKSLEDGRFYAVKVAKEPFKNEYDRKLKVREVDNHHSLSNHPNIVRLHKAWEEDRFVYMQLELCKPSCEEGKPLSEECCWNVLVDIVQALHYIHESGRGHFDVKVENILLGEDNLFKLSDFGLMLKLKETKEVVKEGDAKYVAPELISGGRSQFTPKADIFSLGISILELAGNLELPTGGDVWGALRDNTFPFAQTKHLSNDMFELVIKMMSKDPEKRPSAKEILDLPKVKAVVEQRKLMKLKEFVARFCDPSMNNIVTFFVSLAWSIAITMLQLLAKLMSKNSKIEKISRITESAGAVTEISRITELANKSDISTGSASPRGEEFSMSICDDMFDDSGFVQETSRERTCVAPLSSSTPMYEDVFDSNDNILAQRVKKMRRERSQSLSSDGMADSAQTSSIMSPLRPSPPPPQIFCDWVGITSPNRALKESSVNRNRLHCPAESLLQYGISPLRLSKACKQDYREKKAIWDRHPKSRVRRSLKFDDTPMSPDFSLRSTRDNNNFQRQRSMTPRNLAQSFDEDGEGNA